MYRIQNNANNEAELFIYTLIDSYEFEGITISAKGVIDKLKALGNVNKLTLHINSDGGDLFEAFAIYNYLKNSGIKITAYIDGIAASAASVVAMSASKIIMPANTMMMIHNPSGSVYGEAEDMRDMAGVLDKIANNLCEIYAGKSGQSVEKIKDLLDKESYLTAKECLELGLCDKVIDEIKNEAKINVQDAINEAIKAERIRMQELDKIASPSRMGIINKAKYETGESAKDIALEILNLEDKTSITLSRSDDARELNEGLNFQDVKPDMNAELIANVTNKINQQRR